LATSVVDIVQGVLGYLRSRRDHIHDEAFTAAGWPIGSGCVESGNKLVVEARLKRAGMHWSAPMSIPCWRSAPRSQTIDGTTAGP